MESRPYTGLGDVISGLAGDVQDLVRGEVKLARAEFDTKLHRLIVAAVWLFGGALVAFAGLVVVLEGLAAILTRVVPGWVALLIVGGVIVVVGAVLARLGLGMLSLKTLMPERTAANIQKDISVIKGQAS